MSRLKNVRYENQLIFQAIKSKNDLIDEKFKLCVYS